MHPDGDHDLAPRQGLNPGLVLFPVGHLAIETYASTLSIMWPLFVARFGLAYGAVGLLSMVFRGFMTLPQIGFAALSDRRGTRLLGILGLLGVAVGMSVIGLAPTVGILAILLALAPLGSAAFHPAGTAFMSKALPSRRGTAVALFMMCGSLGSSLGPLLAAWLYGRHGLSASPWLIPLGLSVVLAMALLIPREAVRTAHRQGDERPAAPIPPAIFVLMAAVIALAWVENSLGSYLPLLLTGRGLPLATASQMLFVYSAMSAVGNLTGGALSDRMPRWQVMAMALALTTPLYAGVVLLGARLSLLLPAGMGFAAALNYPVSVAMGQELMPDRTSLASALTMGVSWVLGSVGATLTGVLADRIGIQSALLINTVLPPIGVACMFAVYRLSRRPAGPALAAH